MFIKRVLLQGAIFAFMVGSSWAAGFLAPSAARYGGVSFEFYRAAWNEDFGLDGIANFSLHTTVVVPINTSVRLVSEIPIYSADYETDVEPYYYYWYGTDIGGLTIGNPLIGVSLGAPTDPVQGELGVHLPFTKQNKWDILAVANGIEPYDIESSSPDVTSFYAKANFCPRLSSGLMLNILTGPVLLKPSEGDVEAIADLRVELWMTHQWFSLGLGLDTRYLATFGYGDFFDKLGGQFGLATEATFGRFSSGLRFRIPLDKSVRDVTNFSYGLQLSYRFDSPSKEFSD